MQHTFYEFFFLVLMAMLVVLVIFITVVMSKLGIVFANPFRLEACFDAVFVDFREPGAVQISKRLEETNKGGRCGC